MPTSSNKKKHQGAWIPIALALALAVGFMTGLKTAGDNDVSLVSLEQNKSLASYKVDEVLGFISQRYVDSIDVDQLAEAAIKLIVDSLDPHSHYLDAETVASYQARMDGHYVGLGIEFRVLRDTIVITGVLEDSPAAKSGIERGDQIMFVNGDTISGINLPLEDIYSMLKGEKGSVAELGYRRCSADVGTYEVKRARVNTRSVPFVTDLGDELVYVKISQFNANTSKEFLDMLEPYQEKGELKHLVVDVRQNPGGYLQEAVKILNQFFDKKGKLLVYTEGMNSEKTEYKTAGKPFLNVEELYVLIDEESASASEIVAGTLQDLDRGTIVGRRSFGKGLVQEQYNLSSGGRLKLTVAKYYTPSGRLIQRRVGDNSDYEKDYYNRSTSGEWLTAEDIPRPDSTEFFSPSGRKLYGSRGIVPDIFIPMDSSLLQETSYERFQLSEQLGYLFSQRIHCHGVNRDSIESNVISGEWNTLLDVEGHRDELDIISSMKGSSKEQFANAVTDVISRYLDGADGYYKSSLIHDAYIEAVRQDIRRKSSSAVTKNEVD